MIPSARNSSVGADLRGARTLVDVLAARAAAQSDQTVYNFLSGAGAAAQSVTFGQLHARGQAIAARLSAQGLRGERALLLYPAGLEFIEAFLGCLAAGVIAVPAFPPRANRTLDRLAAMAVDSGARAALAPARLLDRARQTAAAHPALAALAWVATDDAATVEPAGDPLLPADPDAVAYLQYTSGSTSTPKGVMVSHANVLANSREVGLGFGYSPQARAFSWLPHYHDMGLIEGLVQPIYTGFTTWLAEPAGFLQRPALWLEAISTYRITHSGGPNFAYDLCTRRVPADPDRLDLSSWRLAYNGAEPVRAETLERFAAQFEVCGFRRTAFCPAYGLAEATLMVSRSEHGTGAHTVTVERAALEAGRVQPSAQGQPLVGCGRVVQSGSVAIVDPATGRAQRDREIGEIWVSGPSVALGYWNRPDESAATFAALLPDRPERFLRTGDLGFLSDGTLFITGRAKDLIIIRGRNVYPQDVEATAGACAATLRAGRAAAFGVEAGGEERLVLVHETDRHAPDQPAELIADIRAAIVEAHEVDPCAIVLVRPGGVPMTSSGKVQRAQCRRAFLDGTLPVVASWRAPAAEPAPDAVAPAEDAARDTRSWLAARIAAKLGVAADTLAFDQPLARLGLDSLRSIELAHEIDRRCGVALAIGDLLGAPSLEQLAGLVDAAAPARGGDPQEPPGECPLSAGQQALWFLQEVAPDSTAYTIAAALRLTGPLDEAAFEHAAQRVVQRHPSLRARIVSHRGQPRQRFDVPFAAMWTRADLGSMTDAALAAQLADRAHVPFDLERGPLFRMALLRSGRQRVLLLAAHHAVADLWSLSLVLRDLQSLYAQLTTGGAPPAPPAHPAAFVAWQQQLLAGPVGERQLAYWRQRLSGEAPALDLPADRSRPAAQSFRGGVRRLTLGPGLTRALRQLARARGVTLYTLLLTAYQAFLGRITGQRHVWVGSPAAGRTAPQFAELVAYLVNAVVLRADLAGDPTFDALLQATQAEVLGALAHQDVPFSTLVKRLAPARDPSRSPFFDTMFDLHGSSELVRGELGAARLGGGTELAGGVLATPIDLERRAAQFDLSVTVTDGGDDLAIELEYNADLFDAVTVDGLGRRFATLLAAVAADPAARVSRLPVLDAGERALALQQANARPRSGTGLYVHRRFEQAVARAPHAVAAFDGARSVTYAELNARANQLAHRLRALGVGTEAPVALCLEKSLELLVGMLGVLKASGAYVPIDPSLPAARRAFMVRDCGARVVLAVDAAGLELRPGVVVLGEEALGARSWDDAGGADAGEAEASGADGGRADAGKRGGARELGLPGDPPQGALAYLIYTSGTTGTPKAVGIAHSALSSAFEAWERAYQLHTTRIHLQMAAPGFDVFTGDVVRALCSGGTLVLCGRDLLLDPPALAALARQHAVQFAEFVPATLRELAAHLERRGERLDSLVWVAVGSDVWTMADFALFRRVFGPATRLVNSYGVTEATIDSTLEDLTDHPPASGAPPIGRPLANTAAHVLDDQLEPVPAGVTGQLYLGGPAVARGYGGRPDLTASRFVPDPHGPPGARLYRTGDAARRWRDGRIEFVGRADDQVKIRGHRIEPAEVEAALQAHPQVKSAAVVAHAQAGVKRLVAYVTFDGDAPAAPALLRAHLTARLPDAMVPSAVVVLPRMPLTVNGKVDRRALPAPAWESADHATAVAEPQSDVERTLAGIWAGVLGRGGIGRDDDFFALGGDSILSIQVVARAREAGLRLTPRLLFEHPTLAALAAAVGQAPARAAASSTHATSTAAPAARTAPAARPGGAAQESLLPIQHWFLRHGFAEPGHWNMAIALDALEPLSPARLERSFRELVQHHDALRTRFLHDACGWHAIAGDAPTAGHQPLVVDAAAAEPHEDAVARCAQALHQQLLQQGLQQAPLARVGIVRRAPGAGAAGNPTAAAVDTLVLVAHHLIVDGVSLRILAEDLERGMRAPTDAAGLPAPAAALPAATDPPAAWAEALAAAVTAGRFDGEAAHWKRLAAATAAVPAMDGAGGSPLENTTEAVSVELDGAQTQALLQAAAAHGGRADELLLAAVACAYARWTAASDVLVELEGHGRDAALEADVSRTVGWFTQTHPVWIQTVRPDDPAGALAAVARARRAAPGIGFGALREFSGDAALRQALAGATVPPISFNYLGRFDTPDPPQGLWRRWREPATPARSVRNARTHLLEIDASVMSGRLTVRWAFSRAQLSPRTVASVAADFRATLDALVAASAALGTDVEEVLALTPMQEGMLFHHLRGAADDPYVSQLALDLTGDVQPTLLARAFQQACDQHPALRADFAWEGLERPVQVVRRRVRLPVQLHDEPRDGIDTILAAARRDGFEVGRAPLARVDIIRRAPRAVTLAFTHHHLLIDGWSLPFVLTSVFEAYERLAAAGQDVQAAADASAPVAAAPAAPAAAAAAPAAPATVALATLRRYIEWLGGRDLAGAQRYFRSTLQGFTQPTPLPASLPAPRPAPLSAPPARSGVVHAAAPTDIAARARALGLTPNTVVQAAWALVLAACSGTRDVVFGATSSGRPPEILGIDRLVALCINTLPLRVQIDPRARAASFMRQLQRRGAELRQYEHAPLASIQAWSAVPAGTPLFDSLLVFENYPIDVVALGRRRHFRLTAVRLHEQTNYPLTLVASGEDQLSFRAIFDRSRLHEADVRLVLDRLGAAIDALLDHPGAALDQLEVLAPGERHRVLHAWSGSTAAYPRDATLCSIFDAVAGAHPDAPALVCGDMACSYGELRGRALRVAHGLRGHGVGLESRVALAVERSPELITAMLGVLQAGAAYVPIDLQSPPARTARMLAPAGVGLIVTDGRSETSARALAAASGIACVALSQLERAASDAAAAAAAGNGAGSFPAVRAEHLAYVLFTSGSTGEPKGIEVTHRNVLRLVHGVDYVRFGPEQTVLQLAPAAFDASTFEIWGALLHGARLVLAPPASGGTAELAQLLQRFGVTTLWLTAGLFHVMVDEQLPVLARVPQVLAGGDVLSPEHVRRLLAAGCPHVVNGYGPTETTTFACCAALRSQEDVAAAPDGSGPTDAPRPPAAPRAPAASVPIGRPLPNTRAYVLDGRLRPVPIGAPGQLFLGGDGVARGYAGRPDLTAERFVPDPHGPAGARLYRTGDRVRWRADGQLEFLGRTDAQVKVRGFRVEPGEVEAALAALPGVRAAAVAARRTADGSQLIGFVVADPPAARGAPAPAPDAPSSSSAPVSDVAFLEALREALATRLPRFMVPARLVRLDALPLTPNGKVDRRALPDVEPVAPPAPPARAMTVVEEAVADLWCRILQVGAVGPDDDFFALGGHSLHATRLLALLRRAFRVELPMAALLDATTVADMAAALQAHQPQPGHVERAARALAQLRGAGVDPRPRALESAAGSGGAA